ncbi:MULTISPECIES: site-2 protease family protein [unclassified Helicobacter]|uniref:site-2 protease family protein n=1 Tax=unclassified Helicobacter TaxID=2593540 RepID=UPI0018F848EE|nr:MULTISPECIES: site-2 protease family protein [unclassified Helicobacter]
MHGLVAYYYGDDTAKSEGRLSLNPIKHIDLMGSIILPLMLFIAQAPFLFGWAKPVPINMHKIISRYGYMPAIYVSLAGIAYNFLLALFASFILNQWIGDSFDSNLSKFFYLLFYYLVVYNIVLGIFNLWPIPPLDGSQALRFFALKFGFSRMADFLSRMQNFGILIILFILATPLSKIFFYPTNFLIEFFLSLGV